MPRIIFASYTHIGILDDLCKIYGSKNECASAGEIVPLY